MGVSHSRHIALIPRANWLILHIECRHQVLATRLMLAVVHNFHGRMLGQNARKKSGVEITVLGRVSMCKMRRRQSILIPWLQIKLSSERLRNTQRQHGKRQPAQRTARDLMGVDSHAYVTDLPLIYPKQEMSTKGLCLNPVLASIYSLMARGILEL